MENETEEIRKDSKVTKNDYWNIPPEDIIVDPEKRGRKFNPPFENVMELAYDIAKNGQKQPIIVAKRKYYPGKYVLVAGGTRLEAINYLNSQITDPAAPRYRVKAMLESGDETSNFITTIKENLGRNPVSKVDTANNIRILLNFNLSKEEVCEIYGEVIMDANGQPTRVPKPLSWLENHLDLLSLSEEHQLMIHKEELAMSVGLALLNFKPEEREARLKAAKEQFGKVTESSVVAAARKDGVLTKRVTLKPTEERKIWEYAKTHTDPTISKFSEIVMDLKLGKMNEGELPEKIEQYVVENAVKHLAKLVASGQVSIEHLMNEVQNQLIVNQSKAAAASHVM